MRSIHAASTSYRNPGGTNSIVGTDVGNDADLRGEPDIGEEEYSEERDACNLRTSKTKRSRRTPYENPLREEWSDRPFV